MHTQKKLTFIETFQKMIFLKHKHEHRKKKIINKTVIVDIKREIKIILKMNLLK